MEVVKKGDFPRITVDESGQNEYYVNICRKMYRRHALILRRKYNELAQVPQMRRIVLR